MLAFDFTPNYVHTAWCEVKHTQRRHRTACILHTLLYIHYRYFAFHTVVTNG